MKLETFFEKFDQFADAPGAMAKMRALILTLAVQGKLIPFQNNNDTQSVGDHIEFQNGYAFKSDWFKPGGIRLCRNLNISHGILDWRESAYVDDSIAKEFERFALSEGDIVLSLDRPIISTGLKVARILKTDLPCLLLQRVAKPVPKHDQLDMDYFLLWLNSSAFVESVDPGRSNGVPHISTKQVQQLPFALPPLAEQKRIVAKVDELMALCDRLEAQQQERETRHAALARASLARFADAPTPANLPFLFHASFTISPSDLRKSILILAVQGKLIGFQTKDGESTVGDHIEFQNGYAFKSEWFKPEGMRLCRNLNVGHGILDWHESAYVDEKVAKEFKRFALSEGDIVLSLDRPLISTGLKVARIKQSDLPCLLLQRVAKPVPKHDQLDIAYFLIWLNSPAFVDSIDPGRSNGVPHISTKQVQQLPFALPPLTAQRKIVAKVDHLMAMVDQLEIQLTTARATAANLLDAIVAELTGTIRDPRSATRSSSSTPGTGRRGRPRKTA